MSLSVCTWGGIRKDGLYHERYGDHGEERLLAAQLRCTNIKRIVTEAITGGSLLKSPVPYPKSLLQILLYIPKAFTSLSEGISLPKEHAQAGHWAGRKCQGFKEEREIMNKYLIFISLQWDNLWHVLHCISGGTPQYWALGSHPIFLAHTLLAFFPSLSHFLTLSMCFPLCHILASENSSYRLPWGELKLTSNYLMGRAQQCWTVF